MNFKHTALGAILSGLLVVAGTASAQTAMPLAQAQFPAATPLDKPAAIDKGEPAVKHTVIEDEGSRIDELRVRGETQSITVTPKTGGKALANRPYQIISPAGSQSLQEAPNGVRGAAGKRVWHVLSF